MFGTGEPHFGKGRHRSPREGRIILARSLRRGRWLLAAMGIAAAPLLGPPAGASAGVARASAPAGLPGASALLTRAPYLTDLTSSSVQVTWATSVQGQEVVSYGPAGSCGAHAVTAPKGTSFKVGSVTEYQNSVAVTGLSASTAYCYRVTTGGSSPVDLLGAASPAPKFSTLRTAAGSGPLTFDVLADWGDTTNSGVNNGAINANQAGVDAQIAKSGAQFAISAGDLAYPDGSQTEYGDLNQKAANVSAVFGPSYWAVPGESVPLFPISGNHGRNTTFLSDWPEPLTSADGIYMPVSYPSTDGSTAASYPTSYYAFSAGGVRFYVLDASWSDNNHGTATGGPCGSSCAIYQVDHDAHWTASSAEYKWLVKDLAAHQGGVKFAFFHFPLYSDTSAEPSDRYLDNTPGSAGSLEQLLNNNGVGLVFNGHAHDYQRNIAAPGGVTSYVTGGGGGSASAVGANGCATTDAYAVGWFYTRNHGTACGAASPPPDDSHVYHFLKVTVAGRTVTVTPTDSRGRTFDVHAYNFAADATPPSAPGDLTQSRPHPPATVLGWTPATDNIGVSAYDIYRNGSYLATVGPQVTSYTDTTAQAGASYSYRVAARDLAGNTASATAGASATPAVFSDGFETGDLTQWSTVSGGIQAEPGTVENGVYAAEEKSTGTPSYADKTLPASYTELWAQSWVYLKSQSTSVSLFGFRNSSGGSIVDLYVNPGGKLSLRNNVGLATTYSAMALPPGGWHLLVLHAVINGGSSRVDASLDGAPVPGLTLTGQNLGSKPITGVQLGEAAAGRSYDVLFDRLAVTQAAPAASSAQVVRRSR